MDISRRHFLLSGAAAGAVGLTCYSTRFNSDRTNLANRTNQMGLHEFAQVPSTHAVIPVVSDGKYILDEPPEDSDGYFYPRQFEVNVGMSFTGTGDSTNLTASTATPVGFPEQEILEFEIETDGCAADVIQLSETAAQFALSAGRLAAGQTVTAVAKYKMRVCMEHRAFTKERFPADQRKVSRVFEKKFLRNSAGIKCNTSQVREVVKATTTDETHPWDAAKTFHEWVFDNIEGVPGKYTSVEEAIKKRSGDCEERAAVFIALCRGFGIPARLVWVPGHNWAEFGLLDNDGLPHWIPVHTAAYSWFGWTGVHEIVFQKGDNIHIPSRKRTLRLVDDWYRIRGPRPEMTYHAIVKPLADKTDDDPGPGQREKMPNGVWELTGEHPNNEYMRDK